MEAIIFENMKYKLLKPFQYFNESLALFRDGKYRTSKKIKPIKIELEIFNLNMMLFLRENMFL